MSEPMYFYDEFKALVDTLNAEGIEYAVCGGIAVAFYGYARLTRDFDVLIHEEDIERVNRAVKKLGFLFDAGRIPFGVGGPNHREIYRISKISTIPSPRSISCWWLAPISRYGRAEASFCGRIGKSRWSRSKACSP